MTARCSQNKPIVLFAVWIMSGLAFTAFNKYNQILQDYESFTITILVTVLYFVPMLFAIYRQAKATSLRWLIIVTRIFLCLFGVVLAVLFIMLLYAKLLKTD